MTLEQHYAAAREIWIACEAVRRLWLITGDVAGPLRPEGEAMQVMRDGRDRLKTIFDNDFPGQFNPYRDIAC